MNNAQFQTTPNPGGFYVRASDPNLGVDGQFTVTMVNPAPTSHGGFIDLAGAALLGWPEFPSLVAINWTNGGGDGNWSNIANWDLGRTPIPTDSVVIDGTGAIEKVVDEVIAANPKQVEEVKAQRAAGHEKPKTLGWFVGQIMKASGGKANPAAVNEILAKKLGL
jgi:hypothetical protein